MPGVISDAAYQALTVDQTTMATVTGNFGSTATPKQLQGVFGQSWLQTLLQYQVAGDSCVYYLDRHDPKGHAFQLCFNDAKTLVEKAIISASAPNGA